MKLSQIIMIFFLVIIVLLLIYNIIKTKGFGILKDTSPNYKGYTGYTGATGYTGYTGYSGNPGKWNYFQRFELADYLSDNAEGNINVASCLFDKLSSNYSFSDAMNIVQNDYTKLSNIIADCAGLADPGSAGFWTPAQKSELNTLLSNSDLQKVISSLCQENTNKLTTCFADKLTSLYSYEDGIVIAKGNIDKTSESPYFILKQCLDGIECSGQATKWSNTQKQLFQQIINVKQLSITQVSCSEKMEDYNNCIMNEISNNLSFIDALIIPNDILSAIMKSCMSKLKCMGVSGYWSTMQYDIVKNRLMGLPGFLTKDVRDLCSSTEKADKMVNCVVVSLMKRYNFIDVNSELDNPCEEFLRFVKQSTTNCLKDSDCNGLPEFVDGV